MSPDGFGKPPPEEKLLKLIRGRQPRPAPEAGVRTAGPAIAAPAARAIPMSVAMRGLAWPTVAAWVLGGLLGIEALVLVAQAIRPVRPVPVPSETLVAAPVAASIESSAPPAPVDMPSVSASVTRSLFAAAAPAPAASPTASVTAAASRLITRLTLMGIVAGDPPQAIIEDAESKKTFFVTAGQAVVEGAVVDQVLDNRVVLDVGGQKIELSL